MIPLVITDTETKHLQQLREQGDAWVVRARWVRWLRDGQVTDTVPISSMRHDERIAACSWLRQQRHYLHHTIHGDLRAPVGWVEGLPLYRGLTPGRG